MRRTRDGGRVRAGGAPADAASAGSGATAHSSASAHCRMRAGKRDAGVGVRNRCGRAKLEQPSTRSSRRIPTRPDGASLCPTLAFAAPTARGIAPVPCASTYDDSARQLPSYGYGCGPWYGLYITVCSCTFLWTRGASLGADVSARPTWTGRQPYRLSRCGWKGALNANEDPIGALTGCTWQEFDHWPPG